MSVGPLTIEPPLRRVSSPSGSRVLEPRVIRTLIVLAEAQGEVLSREDLIELAWDGVIVGGNAIDRVISQLRKTLAELSGGAVRLETITKVGFRLAEAASPANEAPRREPDSAPLPEGKDRRQFLVAGAVAGLAALSVGGWEFIRGHRPDPRAVDLWQRGQLAQKTGEPGTMETAMGFYKQAVDIDPEYADAWGTLAIAYRHALAGFSTRKTEGYEDLARSAAKRALALDPGQPDADAVGLMFNPKYHRLAAAERDLRGLVSRHPDYWYGIGQLGIVLREAGRMRESAALVEGQLKLDPMLPVAWSNLALSHAYDDDPQGADEAIAEGLRRFPVNRAMWTMHYQTLLLNGRFSEAAAVARDVRERPEYIPAELADFLSGLADALSDRSPATDRQWLDKIRAMLADNIGEAAWLGAVLFQFGRVDDAFSAIESYYAHSGEPLLPRMQTETAFLFSPAILAHRDDPRFAALLRTTGLEAYWQETGSQPDFRRT